MKTHTRTPWEVKYFDDNSRKKAVIVSGDNPIASLHYGFVEEPSANAEFIVRCVNSHEALLEAAKRALKEYGINSATYLEEAIAQCGMEIMKECVTHHFACDCREEKVKKLLDALRSLLDAMPPMEA